MNKKTCMIFAGSKKKSAGGFEDFYAVTSGIDDMKETIEGDENSFDWCQIVHLNSLKLMEKGFRKGKAGNMKWEWIKAK